MLVGGINTFFGYGLYALLTFLMTPWVPYSYELATLLSGVISISFSFLTYKLLVFKTKGRFFREWMRAFGVYGGGLLLNLVLLPPLVHLFGIVLLEKALAPYAAGLVMVGFQVVFSFLGHKKYTFAS